MATTASTQQPQRRSHMLTRRLSSIGLVLAGIMAVFNSINGITSLIDPMFALDPGDPAQPRWMSAMLLGFGVMTLAALVPAWRGSSRAIWIVVVSRLGEAWSTLILPFIPGAPEGLWPFVVALVLGGTLVAALVALRLRR